MKKLILLLVTITVTGISYSQAVDTTKSEPKNWKKGGMTGLNFTQSSFTNWAAGGENAFSATALTTLFANYKKDKWTWDNNIDLAYGLLKSGNDKVRKNEDKIDFTSKLGRYAFYDHWYYTALINFKSQFDDGYNLPNDSNIVSHFMAPGYVIGAIGLDYKTKDNSFSVFISPVTSKTVIVNDQRLANDGAYGVTAAEYDSVGGVYVIVKNGEMINSQFGGYLKIAFKKDIMKNVNLATKLELFSNYLKDPQNIQVNWELLLSMKVNKLITASISTNMIYDHNIPVPVTETVNGVVINRTGPRLQFKEVLAIGVSYKF
jgi:hypothetical protein